MSFAEHPASRNADTAALLPEPTGTERAAPGLSSLEYYQQFFDVDTEQVLSRIRCASWPLRSDFLHLIKNRGDLYGPFWISTTLVFVLAMAGNIVEWNELDPTKREDWRYDFSKVTLAATTIYTYVNLMPFLVWAFIRWRITTGPTLLEVICIYGYSLFAYIPVAIICMGSKSDALRLGFVLAALLLSGAVLVGNFMKVASGSQLSNKSALLVIVGLAHAALAVGFQMYFFQY